MDFIGKVNRPRFSLDVNEYQAPKVRSKGEVDGQRQMEYKMKLENYEHREYGLKLESLDGQRGYALKCID